MLRFALSGCLKTTETEKNMNNRTLNSQDIRTLGLSSLGGALEFYDFVIFIFYAQIIGQHFFPVGDSDVALLKAYGIFAAGYLFRPIGGLIMAHFGDLLGRKHMFTLSIIMMAVPTLLIGLMPTYEQIGFFAPLLLIILRLIQGMAIGGEIPAAWTFVSEHVPDNRVGLANGSLTAGLSFGILLGSLMALLIEHIFGKQTVEAWAWRVPFWIGGLFGFAVMYLRRYLHETPIFKEMQARKQLNKGIPLAEVLRSHLGSVAISMLLTWFLTATVVVLILSTPNLLSGTFQIPRDVAFEMQSWAIVAQSLMCFAYGTLSDKWGCRQTLLVGSVVLIGCAGVFYHSLESGNHSLILWTYVLASAAGGIVGVVPSAMVKMFPAHIRFTALSFSYNGAYAIVGGITLPLIAWLTSHVSKIGAYYYVVFLCVLCCLCCGALARRLGQSASRNMN